MQQGFTIELVCPVCKSALKARESGLFCEPCKQNYEIRDGISVFLPENLCEVKKTDAATYSERAEYFRMEDALKLGRPRFCDRLREFPKESSIFLELCGGAAQHALKLMQEGYCVVESDIALGAVSMAKAFSEALGVSKYGQFCVIDAEQLPFEDESFEGIFLISALHHLPNPSRALAEIQRCLKPNGILLIGYEPNSWQYYAFYPFFQLVRCIIRWRSPHAVSVADDVTFGFSRRKLTKLVRGAELEVLEIRAVDLTAKFYEHFVELSRRLTGLKIARSDRWHKGLKRLDRKLLRMPLIDRLALNFDVVARKRKK